jgi:threonine aldolase
MQNKKVKTIMPVESNIIIFETDKTLPAAEIAAKLSERGILVNVVGSHTVRIVTHLNISDEMTSYVCEVLRSVM